MFRKLSRRLTNKPVKQENDEFRCATAVAHDRARQKSPELTPKRNSWEQGDDDLFYTNSGLEALTLENIIAPTLKRMHPTVATREAMSPPPCRIRPLPPLSEHQMPSRNSVAVLREGVPGITMTPSVEQPNPFESIDTLVNLEVTHLPRGLPSRRKAVSYRTHRDLPLRVQAVRRAHQEEFSRQLANRTRLVQTPSRRGSAPVMSDLPLRAAAPGLETHPDTSTLQPAKPMRPPMLRNRSSSYSDLNKLPQRQDNRSPSRKGKQRVESVSEERDFYLESAQELWFMPKPMGDMT